MGWLVGCGLTSHPAIFQLYIVTETRIGVCILDPYLEVVSCNNEKAICEIENESRGYAMQLIVSRRDPNMPRPTRSTERGY